MYEGGARFDGDSIMHSIKALHAAGKQYEWNVTEPDVYIWDDFAGIAYVNKGSVTDADFVHTIRSPIVVAILLPVLLAQISA